MNNIITRLLLIFSALLTASMLDAGQHQKNKELAVAIDKKIYEQIEQLLDAGADVNKQSSSGLSLLHKAVMESDEKLVALLINKGAELEINDERDRTPLHMTRDAAVARILIDAGAFRNVKDNNGDTPLHYAARKKTCHDVVVMLAENPIVLIDALNNNNWSPLHYAAHHGCNENIQTLIDNRAEIDLRTKLGQTALRLAAESDRFKAVKILLRSGADSNSADNEGITALHWTVENERTEMAEMLLWRGARWDLKDKNGTTVLMIAEEKKLDAIVKIIKDFDYVEQEMNDSLGNSQNSQLEESRDRINKIDEHGWSLLHQTAYSGDYEGVKYLIQHGADLDLKILSSGETALMLAVREQHLDVIQDLINAGANVNAERNDGMTVLEVAINKGNNDIITLLQGAQSTKNVIDKVINRSHCFWGAFYDAHKMFIIIVSVLLAAPWAIRYRIYHHRGFPIASDLSASMASQYADYQRNMAGPQ